MGEADLRAELSGATGQGVRVLLLDSGVEADHPDLHLAHFEAFALLGGPKGYRVEKEAPVDRFGHGTAIASLLLAQAPGITLHSLRVLGSDLRATTGHILAGLQWALDQRYDLVNCSFGTGARQHLEEFKRIVDAAYCRRSWIVAAASNLDPGAHEYPGAFPTVFTAVAADLADPRALRRRPGELAEFETRGVAVRTAWKDGEHRTLTGSSFAAPHLAALLARLRERHPGWNACQAKTALYELCEAKTEAEPCRPA